MSILYIDNTQRRVFRKCPAKWYERYVRGVVPVYPEAQRDDPLALGTLFHDNLANFYSGKGDRISDEVLAEIGPTRECADLAKRLSGAYWNTYGKSEPWKVIHVERALEKSLGTVWAEDDLVELIAVAKCDKVFRVEKPTEVAGGIDGALTLSPGLWAMEHKTKGGTIDRGLYQRSWLTDWQAGFQLICAEAHFKQPLQGVLVNVVEKPDERKPTRKCSQARGRDGCGGTFDFASWIPTDEDGVFKCPFCGEAQKLRAQKTEKKEPVCFRFKVQRSRKRLERDEREIYKDACAMAQARAYPTGIRMEWDECVTFIPQGVCDYAQAHECGIDPLALGGFRVEENPLGYIGIEEARVPAHGEGK